MNNGNSMDVSDHNDFPQGVFKILGNAIPKVTPFSSESPEIESIDLLIATLKILNKYWTNYQPSDQSSFSDFYSDDFLGYNTCEYIAANAQALVQSDESAIVELTEALIEYLHLNCAHRSFGDITKRIESALAELIHYEINVENQVDRAINNLAQSKYSCLTPELCEKSATDLLETHQIFLESLERITQL
jgi:hypothetical protein